MAGLAGQDPRDPGSPPTASTSGANRQVHELLRAFADEGGTIIVASTDVAEILDLCDRIAIMRHGSLTDVLSTEGHPARGTVRGARPAEELVESLIQTGTAEAV